MAPHQQRVVDEKADLDVKIDKLMAFIAGEVFPKLPPAEQERLGDQLVHMGSYSRVLRERIVAFTAPDSELQALSTLHAGAFTQRSEVPQ